jgi:signal transduction histidine kinase
VLSPAGYRIMVARTAAAALAMAAEQQPDLILLDVMLPGQDGYTLCRQLKAEPRTASIPVIFLTARGSEADVAAGFDAGGVDYLTKPFRVRELQARVRTHLALLAAQRRLSYLNEQKSQFVAMAAHDLKNPLFSISGYTELLLESLAEGRPLTAADGESRDMLESILRTATHMSALIHDLLQAEALQAGKVALHPECCDLNRLVLDLIELNQPHARKKQITLRYTPAGPCVIVVDRRSLLEAFDNLINNAVKYSPPGATVHLGLLPNSPREDQVRFSVRDEGPGLTEQDHERLFGRFQRLSAKPTGGESSTGLGLSIVKATVERLGGAVSAVSPGPGRGSTFIIDLPFPPLPPGVCPLPPPPKP